MIIKNSTSGSAKGPGMQTRLIGGMAVLALLCASMALAVATSPATAQAAMVHSATLQGYLVTEPVTTTAPVTLTVQTRSSGVVQVAVSSATSIVRRYGATSSLDELGANDVLQIRGQKTGPNTFTASLVRDLTLQAAYTRLTGLVTTVSPTSVSVVVQKDANHSPFVVGANMTLPVGASTEVMSGTTVQTGTTTLITAGSEVVALGVFDRISHGFNATFRIRVTGPVAHKGGNPTDYDGYLVTVPATTTLPVNLTVQTLHRGVITVTVTTGTSIVRKYGAPSSVDEFSANDVLHIVGAPTTAGDPHAITATSIRDESIQAAYTRVVGQVTAFTTTSVSVVVQHDMTGHSPLIAGQSLTLPIGTSTKITGTLANGVQVVALGVFNTASHTMMSTFRIRVL